jgi:hypothetical protein
MSIKSVGPIVRDEINEHLGCDLFWFEQNHFAKRWTRGDGMVYYDPKYKLYFSVDPKNIDNVIKKVMPHLTFRKAFDKASKYLNSNGKSTILYGPHSSEKSDAIYYKGIYFMDYMEYKGGEIYLGWKIITKKKFNNLMSKD